jgi:hypothetical protein
VISITVEPLITDTAKEFQIFLLQRVSVSWCSSSNEYYNQSYVTVVGMSVIKLHIGMIKKILLSDDLSHCQC